MKKILTTLFFAYSIATFAADVSYDFSQQGFANAQKVSSGVIDSIHNTRWEAIGGQPEATYYDGGAALRIYKNGTFKVSSNKVMTAIDITLDASKNVFDQESSQTPNDTVFTWTYTATSGQVRVQKVEIMYADYMSVAETMEEYAQLNLPHNGVSSIAYKVRGYVTKWISGYPQYQNGRFYIDDNANGSTNLLYGYNLVADNDSDKRALNIGEYIEVTAYLKNYNGKAELVNGTFHTLSSIITPPTPTYTLTINAGEGGSVNTLVNGTYTENQQVTITATPDDNYIFSQWSDGNTDNPRTLTITQDTTLQAIFELACVFPSLEGKKGDEILLALHDLISEHVVLSYDDIRGDRAGVDFKEDGTLWDIYSDCVFYKNSTKCSGTITDDCECYNREHIVPQSWWGNDDTQPMRFDLHNVISTDGYANSMRGNCPYGEVNGTPEWSNSLGSKKGASNTYSKGSYKVVFEPIDMYKGDFARALFYMITCYPDKDFTQKGQGFQVFEYSNNRASFTSDARNLLLKWHRNDPVSQKEIDRNNAVEAKQGNRNPFVDDPELVEYIWGNHSSKSYICGADDEMAVEETYAPTPTISTQKHIEESHLFITLPDGTKYSATGVKVK